MTRLVHLTDLHFGLARPDLVVPLAEAVRAVEPDLVIVSGDLVQRARTSQFQAARDFLDGLQLPWIAVPGNHDIPLFNLPARLLHPFRAYQQTISPELEPILALNDLRIYGANSVLPTAWRRGIARPSTIARISRDMLAGPRDVTNILIFHHPFEEPPGFRKGETRHADEALATLAGAGLHLILSGHLHHWNPAPGIDKENARPVLQVQNGTALCGREGERQHVFAVLDIDGPDLKLTPFLAIGQPARYVPGPVTAYRRGSGGWLRL